MRFLQALFGVSVFCAGVFGGYWTTQHQFEITRDGGAFAVRANLMLSSFAVLIGFYTTVGAFVPKNKQQ
ncbi:MAG: hypothetical protein JST44_22435 [Cyanobacteria bacterium SZAS LIN-5]|nr:hypothetical protein [Cyanobacteria bacterium SZAS LIN-5]